LNIKIRLQKPEADFEINFRLPKHVV